MLSQFFSEVCAPVVVVTSTGESESICLKNGMLLHEMLSAFGHLDGINATIRASSSNIHVSDAHLRFERETEVRAKSSLDVETLLRSSFEEFDLQRMPGSVAELRLATPSAWTPGVEQAVFRSMTFSEYEMISHPVVLLTVVATSDVDPVACMQQLASVHHTPQSVLSGQYDPESIHRVYLLLHDASSSSSVDANATFRGLLAAGFPLQHTKFLTINSLPADAPNLQQPDMWSRWFIPKYFPRDAPQLDPTQPQATNPLNGTRVLGARLSMEDFMALREFCLAFFHKEVVPTLERRISVLTKQVNEARKGMRNVLKSFWRKPREEGGGGNGKGPAVRYRHDRIETQILLLADTSFCIKDFETASSMYRLVRDDYKSDKSTLHLAHSTLMLAASLVAGDGAGGGGGAAGSRGARDLPALLDNLREVLQGWTGQAQGTQEPPHLLAYFALLAAELYSSPAVRAPLVAAEFLLQAAAVMSKLPLLSALLTERAAGCFLQGGHKRKYSFHCMLAGHKMMPTGPRARRHSLCCFVAALLVHEGGRWSGLQVKLSRSTAEELKARGSPDGGQRALLLLLRMLSSLLGGNDDFAPATLAGGDAVALLRELSAPGPWGAVRVSPDWLRSSMRDLLLAPPPLEPLDISPGAVAVTEVMGGLSVPALNRKLLGVMVPVNGAHAVVPHESLPATPAAEEAEQLRVLLEVERRWSQDQEQASGGGDTPTSLISTSTSSASSGAVSLAQRWAAAEHEMRAAFEARKLGAVGAAAARARIPLGEPVVVRVVLTNKLNEELRVFGLQLTVSEGSKDAKMAESLSPSLTAGAGVGVDVVLGPLSSKEVLLSAPTTRLGSFCAQAVRWRLSDSLHFCQPLLRPGALLHKTLQQRAAGERGPDSPIEFDVLEPHPLLRLSLEGMGADALQGELIPATLRLRNEGEAPACEIDLKFSQPCCVLIGSSGRLVRAWGQSATICRLPPDTVVAPKGELVLDLWVRFNTAGGRSRFAVLAAYSSLRGDQVVPLGPGLRRRTSVLSVDVSVAPSLSLQVDVADEPSSTQGRTLLLALHNQVSSAGATLVSAPPIRSSIAVQQQHQQPAGEAEAEDAHRPNAVFIEGIFMLGGAVPDASYPWESLRGTAGRSAGPSERLTLCLPVTTATGSPSSLYSSSSVPSSSAAATAAATSVSRGQGHASWVLPLSPALASNGSLPAIVTRTLCSLYATVRLQRLLRDARQAHWASASEQEAPRSLQQVRRDNERGAAAASASASGAEDGSNPNSAPGSAAQSSADLQQLARARPSSHSFSFSSSPASGDSDSRASCRGIPLCVEDLADMEQQTGCVNVTVVWSCRWKGSVRRGVHSVSQVPLSVGGLGLGQALRPSVADAVSVALKHDQQASLPSAGGGVRVPVSLELRLSPHAQPVVVRVEALQPQSGPEACCLRWEGKTAYADVALAPAAPVSLAFDALIAAPGVFDLKRFRVSVVSLDGKQAIKVFADNSFVSVVCEGTGTN